MQTEHVTHRSVKIEKGAKMLDQTTRNVSATAVSVERRDIRWLIPVIAALMLAGAGLAVWAVVDSNTAEAPVAADPVTGVAYAPDLSVSEGLGRIGYWTTISGPNVAEYLYRVGDWTTPATETRLAPSIPVTESLSRIGNWTALTTDAGFAPSIPVTEGLSRIGDWATNRADAGEYLQRIGDWAHEAEMAK